MLESFDIGTGRKEHDKEMQSRLIVSEGGGLGTNAVCLRRYCCSYLLNR